MTDVARTARVARALALTAKPAGDASRYIVSGERSHLVVSEPNGRWTCDCYDSQFGGGGRTCKHIYAVILSALPADVLDSLRSIATLPVGAFSNHPGVRRESATRADVPARRRFR